MQIEGNEKVLQIIGDTFYSSLLILCGCFVFVKYLDATSKVCPNPETPPPEVITNQP